MRNSAGITRVKGTRPLPFSEAVLVNDCAYLSGQLAFDELGQLRGDNIEEQTAQCLRNIEAVLQRCDLDMDAIFKVTAWLVRAEDFAGFNRVYSSVFHEIMPVRSTVRSDLMLPRALVEIEVVARRPGPDRNYSADSASVI